MKGSGSRWVRYSVQLGFLAFMTYLGYMHQRLGGGPQGVPPVDALCPLGGAESLYGYLSSGNWLRRTAPSALILLIAVISMTAIAGRVFCGWICPLGTIGEWSASLGKGIGIKQRRLSAPVDAFLRLGKYVVLSVAVFGSWHYGTLLWRGYDPWVAWMHLSAGWAEIEEAPWSFAVLFGLVIGASMVVERFWCRYLCPLGGLLSLFQKISPVKVRRDESLCVHCHRCGSVCPMGLDPESKEVETSADCISCGECVLRCPVDGALKMGTSRFRLSPVAVGFIGLALFFGVYGTARLGDKWETSTPAPSNMEGGNPADLVYGWMSLEQVSQQTGVPVETLIALGGLPQDTPRDLSMKKIDGFDDHAFTESLARWFEEKRSEKAVFTAEKTANPDEIRGSSTLNEIALAYGIGILDIVAELTVEGWSGDIQLDRPVKDIAKEREREVQEIRDVVKRLLNR